MAGSTIYGYPRIGPQRELKRATERYWSGRISADELQATAASLRQTTWTTLRDAGIDHIPSNHFSFYDHVLDTAAMVGAIPARYQHPGGPVGLDTYFAMARGHQDGTTDVTAMEMTKWFDTNYHYIVPELGPDTSFALSSTKALDEFREAEGLGITTRPVVLGPVTFLLLSKPAESAPEGFNALTLLDGLLDVYSQLLSSLRQAGVEWVQFDEPAFVEDRTPDELAALAQAYDRLGSATDRPRTMVATYFDHAGAALPVLAKVPIEAIGLDFTHGGRANIDQLRAMGGIDGKTLVAGVVNGRNIWVNDIEASLGMLDEVRNLAADVIVSSSCSLLHVPLDVEPETEIDPEVRPWLAFARQKLAELGVLSRGYTQGRGAVATEIAANRSLLEGRRNSVHTNVASVRRRLDAIGRSDVTRASHHGRRAVLQQQRLGLQPLPTTTIGSFPQTTELREARAALRAGRIDAAEYRSQMEAEIGRVVRLQEELGIDVLVHGEPERNDMVQYFAEQLNGYAFTNVGWVQSYGTRYVRPPIIFGDITRPNAMTVQWSTYAQSLTRRPMKGMVTGPVTMLRWSFVRDDQPESATALQIGLALRDEVLDLEAAGIGIIQVDEPALREGMPLRAEGHADYVQWAAESFRLATAAVRDDTQIHTHMCYSEFGEIIEVIADLDADVTSVEAARSRMELTRDLASAGYSRGIGPGIYDIHSPRVPSTEDIEELLREALAAIDADKLWVNPDCGLKTRGYAEVEAALRNMVVAATTVRAGLAVGSEAMARRD